MPKNFISNSELRKLLSKATDDERLALTKILDENQANPFQSDKLQEKICLCGGHGVANWFRGSGTGYLDIIDDVAGALGIHDRSNYQLEVKYYDEIPYIKGENQDGTSSSKTQKYDRLEATKLGNDYAIEHERKIIIKVMENAYKKMKADKEKFENELTKLKNEKLDCESQLPDKRSTLIALKNKVEDKKEKMSRISDPNDEKFVKLQVEVNGLKSDQSSVQVKIKLLEKRLEAMPEKISAKEVELNEAKERLDNFDAQLSRTVNQFNSSHLGAITGTAGLMALANLGGFATYTFLTSMMSTLSFGTLGFGAYTAATSFLSVVIGPVGWAGLGLWTIFALGKPDKNKLVLLVATIGAIRQRILYESDQS